MATPAWSAGSGRPADAEIAEQIAEEHVERVLQAARLYYDYILVDLLTESAGTVGVIPALSVASLGQAEVFAHPGKHFSLTDVPDTPWIMSGNSIKLQRLRQVKA
ncbi:hypothetical protein JQC72_06910 [Polycladomyces sp. WAk]|uniref:Uncharacterized protein n=1 Tax=Polycladomyces zharkentensis TaxID=2807616 RepID=A0ABS2WIA9_9BACL|nr:hypothetical protein [Polycladomyces sp. WAk]MBN2909251.1 hypothetical protein [Polycladomyces sp. WAk]